MKKILTITLVFILLFTLSGVSSHGVDVTNDKMVIANDTNGQQIKDIADGNGINISVYKFTSEDEVEHQLEHMLNNSNKVIVVASYQDVAQKFLESHSDVSNRLIICDNPDEQMLKDAMVKAVNQENTNVNNNSFPLLVSGVVIGIVLGICAGVIVMKKKGKKE